jgi:hypothetical protein
MTVTGDLESNAHRQMKLYDFWSAVPNIKRVTSQIIMHNAKDSHLKHIIPFSMHL